MKSRAPIRPLPAAAHFVPLIPAVVRYATRPTPMGPSIARFKYSLASQPEMLSKTRLKWLKATLEYALPS